MKCYNVFLLFNCDGDSTRDSAPYREIMWVFSPDSDEPKIELALPWSYSL
jgi:hypothetical protein